MPREALAWSGCSDHGKERGHEHGIVHAERECDDLPFIADREHAVACLELSMNAGGATNFKMEWQTRLYKLDA